jgi:endo-1,3-1,4-beta-glycanase ExoK
VEISKGATHVLISLFLALLTGDLTGDCAASDFRDKFEHLDSTFWSASDGWSDGPWFLNDWRKSQLRTGSAGLTVTLDRNPASKGGYSSGAIQSRRTFRYGYFEARMTAAPGSGVDTGFFTYTGPTQGQPWNEVDVEILGKDTRAVQFTYHTGNRQKATTVKLPFDSAMGSHTYAFDWEPEHITWYVDGKSVHTENGDSLPLPNEPQKIIFNVASSNASPEWLGRFTWPGRPILAQLRCIARAEHFNGAQLCI